MHSKVEINYSLRSHILPAVDMTARASEPRLLFEDSAIIKRIENHPMALWRLQHIREGWEEKE